MTRDLGDWQTSDDLAHEAVRVLARTGERWNRILEPTCGTGSFLRAAVDEFGSDVDIIGLDIQQEHLDKARASLAPDSALRLWKEDIFGVDLAGLPWRADGGPTLVLGNPPWVTNSELSSLGSLNRPVRSNIKGLSGMDAITGASNFDIAEYIIIKSLAELAADQPTLAMLVKTSVARRVIEHAYVHDWPVRRASLHRFDARVEFGASVDACLFIMALDGMSDRVRVPVYPTLRSEDPETVMGFGRGKLVADTDSYEEVEFADGESPVMWRQGIKHDAAKLMELAPSPTDAGSLTNGFGEEVDVEGRVPLSAHEEHRPLSR